MKESESESEKLRSRSRKFCVQTPQPCVNGHVKAFLQNRRF
jgi:hypothetical protein